MADRRKEIGDRDHGGTGRGEGDTSEEGGEQGKLRAKCARIRGDLAWFTSIRGTEVQEGSQ